MTLLAEAQNVKCLAGRASNKLIVRTTELLLFAAYTDVPFILNEVKKYVEVQPMKKHNEQGSVEVSL